MNGYNDIHTEPDDEEFALSCGYEIISDEELYDIISLSFRDHPVAASNTKRGGFRFPFFSKKSSISLSASSGVSSMKKPSSSCSLSSQVSELSEGEFSSRASSGVPESIGDSEDDEVDHQLSVENLWYMIQQKRHHHDLEEEMKMAHHHFMTMEHHASNNKLTEWFSNFIHFPEKLRQIVADKHRFNINKAPQELREELKHIYVY